MTHSFRASVLWVLAALLSSQLAFSQGSLTSEAAMAEQLVLTQKASYDVPGMAVGVIKDGQVFYTGAFGVQDMNSQKPLTTQSLFHMASVSKPFVATAVVQLIEQGKLKLEDKLTDQLPYFSMADERYMDITLGQMLDHSSGIPNLENYEWDKPQYDDGAAERYAKSFTNVELDFKPGKRFNYSNAAFDILCDVIAKASGMTFEDYVKKNILEPVGMVNSTFYKPEVPEELATGPHIFGNDLKRAVSEVYPYNRRHAGSSTLHSNVEDMMRWAEVNLNKGIINGKRIYQESSYELLTKTRNRLGGSSGVGLSWFRTKVMKSTAIYHTGEDLGYSTFFAFFPEAKAAIVLMCNVDSFPTTYGAYNVLFNVVFGKPLAWKAPIAYKLKDYILSEGIEKTKEVYYQERKDSPQEYSFGSDIIGDLGNLLLEKGHAESALDIFLFNVELEPKNAGWYEGAGDAYAAMDSTQQAIEWYQKALKRKPGLKASRDKLNELLEGK